MQTNDHVMISVLPVSKFRQYREYIGSVCVQWGYLELCVERVLAAMRGNGNVVAYEAMIRPNVIAVETEIPKSNLIEDQKKNLAAALEAIKRLYVDRHRVIHGLWGLASDGEVHSIYFQATKKKREVVPGQRMTLEDLRDIKWKIVNVRRALETYMADGGEITLREDEEG